MVAQVSGVAIAPKSLGRAKVAGVKFVRFKRSAGAGHAMLAWNPSLASKPLLQFIECATAQLEPHFSEQER